MLPHQRDLVVGEVGRGGAGRHHPDLLALPQPAGGVGGKGLHVGRQLLAVAAPGEDRLAAEHLHPQAAGVEALHEHVGGLVEEVGHARVRAGGADDVAGGVGQPHLLGQPLPRLQHDDGATRLLGVLGDDPALLRAGPAAVLREVDREQPAQHAVVVEQGSEEHVVGVPGVVGVDRHQVGHPAVVLQ